MIVEGGCAGAKRLLAPGLMGMPEVEDGSSIVTLGLLGALENGEMRGSPSSLLDEYEAASGILWRVRLGGMKGGA